jgi:hypothetical protein
MLLVHREHAEIVDKGNGSVAAWPLSAKLTSCNESVWREE